MKAPEISLGTRVRDQVSGFYGIVTGRAVYLFEAPKLLVAPEAIKDGAPGEACWLPEARLAPFGEGRRPGFEFIADEMDPEAWNDLARRTR